MIKSELLYVRSPELVCVCERVGREEEREVRSDDGHDSDGDGRRETASMRPEKEDGEDWEERKHQLVMLRTAASSQ